MSDRKKLWGFLGSLALLIGIILILDTIPTLDSSTPVVTEDSGENEPADMTEALDIPVNNTLDSSTPLESAPVSTEAETSPPDPTVSNTLILTFLGDCAPGSPLGTSAFGSLNAKADAEGTSYFFQNLLSLLSEDDYTITANTCLLTDSPSDSDSTLCLGPISNASMYSDGSVELVSFSTSQVDPSMNVDWSDTMQSLQTQGILCASDDSITYLEKDGLTIALFTTTLVKNVSRTDQISQIETAANTADYVIVYFRGGEANTHTPEEWLCSTLRRYADAGADLLIGHGTGVLRPIEEYNDSTIVYSLGSLIDGSTIAAENITMLLRFTLEKQDDGTIIDTISCIPCLTYDTNLWQPTVLKNEDAKNRFFAFLNGSAISPVSE